MLRLIIPPRPATLAPSDNPFATVDPDKSSGPNILMVPANLSSTVVPTNSLNTGNKPNDKSYSKLSWLLGGVVIGSFLKLDPLTIIVMVALKLLWENRPLPEPFNDLTPQDLIVIMFKTLIRSIAGLLTRSALQNRIAKGLS